MCAKNHNKEERQESEGGRGIWAFETCRCVNWFWCLSGGIFAGGVVVLLVTILILTALNSSGHHFPYEDMPEIGDGERMPREVVRSLNIVAAAVGERYNVTMGFWPKYNGSPFGYRTTTALPAQG